MRRVSSRQRLVSWDAFDAAASDSEEEQDFITCYDASALSRNSSFCDSYPLLALDSGALQQFSSSRRKREREIPTLKGKLVSELLPVLITANPDEFDHVQRFISKPSTLLESLVNDVQLQILSFLSVMDARTMGRVSKQYRRLLQSKEGMMLWKEWFQQSWPNFIGTNLEFVDRLELSAVMIEKNQQPNMSVLMGLAARRGPSGIDTSRPQFPPPSRLRNVNTPSRRIMFRIMEVDGETVTQYLGPVGTGDRCIRANQPLAKPKRLGMSFANKASLLDFMCRGRSARAVHGSTPPWRPFVSPFCRTPTSNNKLQVDLTPRLVSYYEVSILLCPQNSPLYQRRILDAPPRQVTDCIAIGVATSSFQLHSRKPGWDVHSFGYHGDDGGIFHASGDMTRRFGPSFGPGDTVGCGVDYVTGGVFFTLNGNFLGYGWTNVEMKVLEQDLYPTIGVDSNCPVATNFGEKPFEFPLESIVERQIDIVKGCWTAKGFDG
eukprot:CAMPEP_0202480708 /NCGR_PEP_ID=MMETSP1361-20130828/583_1 /ASSEMBLY_ACC=CAM_ASM_000849 /TAXON_ID=210615 /ORGANISM="Staurosira complex sp., Strain CCMP2646" /LENGTH=490 /DNA_ID=CAMNT_0049108161 /DNA_START=82 /DNA_END=1554 /DNA_ORIENTATION=+